MSVGQIPQAWMHAVVMLVYKNDNASDLQKYRSTSLAHVASKIMECIIATDVLPIFVPTTLSIGNSIDSFLATPQMPTY